MMTIQQCIALLVKTYGWTFEGSFMQQHPPVPASCAYSRGETGGHRERRYEFSFEGEVETISFNTRGVRARADVITRLKQGDKYTIAKYGKLSTY